MSTTTTRRPLPALAFLLVLTVLTAIVWWRVLHRPDSTSTAKNPVVAQPIRCTPGAKAVTLPKPGAVTVVVLNGAGRDQLASQVSALLKARGFKTGTPNDAAALTGVGQIQFGTLGKAGATLVSFHLPGATMVSEMRSDAGVTVVLGSGYKGLASTAAAAKAVAQATKPC
ncbi:MAG: LytR C-terminal domain-containing protein [Jatrophihabitantaceae bacterium]